MCNNALGEGLIARHIRNGVELDPIDVNHNYDFNYQQTNFIPRVKILPVSIYLIMWIVAAAIKYTQNIIVYSV